MFASHLSSLDFQCNCFFNYFVWLFFDYLSGEATSERSPTRIFLANHEGDVLRVSGDTSGSFHLNFDETKICGP